MFYHCRENFIPVVPNWTGDQAVDLNHSMLYWVYLWTSNSMLSCIIISGFVIQTNATKLLCFVVILCSKRCITVRWCHVHLCRDRCTLFSGVMMDVGLENTNIVGVFVSVSLFIVQMISISLKNFICYLSCKCVWKWTCKEKYKEKMCA